MDLIATTQIRNETIISARRALGLSQMKLALASGVPHYIICLLEKLDYRTRSTQGHAKKLSDFLGISIEDVLPSSLAGEKLQTDMTRTATVDSRLLAESIIDKRIPPPDESIIREESIKEIKDTVLLLRDRERSILTLRFGLDGNEKMTLEETGRELKISRERVRQIESRALSEMKGIMRPTHLIAGPRDN